MRDCGLLCKRSRAPLGGRSGADLRSLYGRPRPFVMIGPLFLSVLFNPVSLSISNVEAGETVRYPLLLIRGTTSGSEVLAGLSAKTAIKKAAYRIADRCTVILQSPAGDELPVLLTFKGGTTERAASSVVRSFYQDLLDQELREQVAEETGPMRALILAHAFSKTDLIRRE
ncbi:His-Xaa-Ser system protein HxsD [bacterium]|nr:MAG: His-Xaa-Ser system protein HxsD [bacterium]